MILDTRKLWCHSYWTTALFQADILERPKELDRNTSLACDVSTYFEEE